MLAGLEILIGTSAAKFVRGVVMSVLSNPNCCCFSIGSDGRLAHYTSLSGDFGDKPR